MYHFLISMRASPHVTHDCHSGWCHRQCMMLIAAVLVVVVVLVAMCGHLKLILTHELADQLCVVATGQSGAWLAGIRGVFPHETHKLIS